MTIAEIIARVRAAIDESSDNESGFIAQSKDEQSLERIIRKSICAAFNYLITRCSRFDLWPGEVMNTEGYESESGVVRVKLPEDYGAFVRAKLKSWSYAPDPITENSQEYMMQSDDTARGSYDRPVVAMVNRDGRYLEFYSQKVDGDAPEVNYVKMISISDADGGETELNIPKRLEGALVYQTAYLTLVAVGNTNSQLYQAISDKMMKVE